VRIGVDAFNLTADRRGMGRVARTALTRLQQSGAAEIHLIAKDGGAARALQAEFSLPTLIPCDLQKSALDAVWFPWNGMRFAPHAPAIVTVYDLFAFRYPARGFIARRREQQPIRRAILGADRILTLSQWTAQDLRSTFGVANERIRVCSPGIDSFWHPVNAEERTTPYMLFVGGPDARKNAALLFAAFGDAFGESSAPALVVAGSLSDADERALAASRFVHERVKPDDERLRTLYSGALAVAIPSLAEGYGLPAIEAMACGAPAIAADAAALPEACDGAALLVPPADRSAWSRVLAQVAGDSELRETLRRRGFERVQRLDPDGVSNQLLEFARQSRAIDR
jgi:glycosyltransferase involved in cell wall biosynthesis